MMFLTWNRVAVFSAVTFVLFLTNYSNSSVSVIQPVSLDSERSLVATMSDERFGLRRHMFGHVPSTPTPTVSDIQLLQTMRAQAYLLRSEALKFLAEFEKDKLSVSDYTDHANTILDRLSQIDKSFPFVHSNVIVMADPQATWAGDISDEMRERLCTLMIAVGLEAKVRFEFVMDQRKPEIALERVQDDHPENRDNLYTTGEGLRAIEYVVPHAFRLGIRADYEVLEKDIRDLVSGAVVDQSVITEIRDIVTE